jgi:hypothetical protein
MEKTGAQDKVKEIKHYQEKWLQHVQRMDTNRILKQALQYKPKGRRNIGRPRKRWTANSILRIKEPETRLILHEHDDEYLNNRNSWAVTKVKPRRHSFTLPYLRTLVPNQFIAILCVF